MLRQQGHHKSDVVSAIRRPFGFLHLRNWRGLLAVLVAGAYLLSGALHGVHGLDVTNPRGASEVAAMLDQGTGHADHKALGGHHCHGCFSVTVAQPNEWVTLAGLVASVKPRRLPAIIGVGPGTEPPPPKHLA